MRKFDYHWRDDKLWYEIKDGIFVVRNDAPLEAQLSYNHYRKQSADWNLRMRGGKEVLMAKVHNFDLIRKGDWKSTEYNIYSTGECSVCKEYVAEPWRMEMKLCRLETDQFDSLKEILSKPFNPENFRSDALDGESWEISSFDNNYQIIENYKGYIYGIKHLEAIEKILRKLSSVNGRRI